MSNFKPATVVFSMPGSSSSNKFDKPLDELIKQDGNRPADIKAKKQNKRLDLKGVVQKNVKENTKSKPARALNATKSEHNPRLNKRVDDKKGRPRPVFIVPPQKDEPQKGGVKFSRPNNNNNHIDEKVKIVVKNDQFKQKETKKKDTEPKERIRIRVNRTDDEMMDSDGDRDNGSPQRARHTDKKRRRSRDRSESDSDEERTRRRRPYSVNQVQPSPVYMQQQPHYSVPMAPAPVAAPMQRVYGTPAPGPQGIFQNILTSILKQNIDERLNQTGLPPPPQPTMPVRSYGYSYPVAAQPVVEEPMPMFADNDRSGGLTLSQRFGSSSSSSKSSSSGTSKITLGSHPDGETGAAYLLSNSGIKEILEYLSERGQSYVRPMMSKVKGVSTEVSDNEFMNLNNPEERKLKKDLLKSKYTTGKRVQEVLSLIGFVVLFGICVYRIIVHYPTEDWWLLPASMFVGLLGADFFSGLVHWLADTWGTLETPIFGPTFIRSFREHHIEPTEMTRHDLIETNGDNALVTLGILYLCSIKELYHEDGSRNLLHYFTMATWTVICFGAVLTNQIHKWSHTYKPPALVILAQNCGLILSRKNHGVHHRPPFDKYYCITNGWLNPVLAYIDFWRRLEAVVTFVTGYVPREDDHRWTGLLPSPDVVVKAAKERGTALSGRQ